MPRERVHSDAACDVAIIGAGVAGLAAAGALARAGKVVRCLEAGDGVGGRVRTVHDPLAPVAIELGAEFIHGLPPETWGLVRENGFTVYEHTAKSVHLALGRVSDEADFGELFQEATRRRDESFEAYISRSRRDKGQKDWARRYVEGFNAARVEEIGVESLKQDERAAEEIDGDRSFRMPAGYDAVPLALLRRIPEYGKVLTLNALVERVEWRRGSAKVIYKAGLEQRERTLRCRQLIVTVPLGVLQAGVIEFDPEPAAILRAAGMLKFGHVYRVTFRFESAFWEEAQELKGVGFLFSKERHFPTWWTMHPVIAPVLTGWMAGSAADDFQGSRSSEVAASALRSLGNILNRKIPEPSAAYFHNWQSDPLFRGAYSYVPAGALAAREVLATPVDGTLFFAGEATETTGHSSTVHGAIQSGLRAASQIP